MALLAGPAAAQSAIVLPDLPSCGPVHGPRLANQVINLPIVDSEGEVELGQSMISSIKADVHEAGLTLTEPLSIPGRYMFNQYRVDIPAGPLQPGERAYKRVYVPSAIEFRYNNDRRPRAKWAQPEIALWVDPATPADLMANVDFGFSNEDVRIQGAQFEQARCMKLGSESFRRELLYSGVAQGTISLEYREFINDMARPAFSQTLRYDLNEGRTIGFRGARFEILDANNVSVRYRVLRELE